MIGAMAFPAKLLNEGERVVFTTRTHVKALFVPVLVLVVVVVLAALGSAWIDNGVARKVIWAIAVVLLLVFTVWPFLNWLGATYTVTNRRLITRAGVLTREGHDIPLNRISDVSYERGLLDRMLGCGTLVISDASTHGRVSLPDVPDVEQLHLRMTEELFDTSKADDGT
jgi:membrane protein YdbS with pleckstrin-like domain